jgi:Tol biopolymer transport system component
VFGRDIEEQTWEIAADGSAPRRLLPGWLDSTGRWTPDGHFFIFPAFHGGGHGLWALRERSRFAAWLDRGPFQLASSLNGVWQPTVTKDGKKLFAIFTDPDRGELLRYDPTIHQFVAYPVPKGISGGQTTFAPDGKQIVYIKYPEMNLWKMNADGSNQQQLEERAALPQWSPDGQRIAYMGWDKGPNSPTTIRIVSSEGGAPLQAVAGPSWQGAPNWTPDGLAMIFGDNGPRLPITPSACLHRFDFRSGKTTNLQGSEGLWTARACPAGRYVAALTLDYRKLVLYDLKTSTRTDLATFPDSTVGENPTWSKDGKWLYYDSPHSAHPAIYRISIPGKRIERVASLAGIPRVHGGISWWIGLTPDNQPLILKDIHSQEIYSMDWIAP